MDQINKMRDKNSSSRLSVPEAAAIMGVTPQFLRLGLQQGKFPFGVAVRMKRWAYFIRPDEFRKYVGS